jgi:hypothetical protein
VRSATGSLRVACSNCASECQIRRVSSSEHETISLLSEEKAAELAGSVWPFMAPIAVPSVFHILTVESAEAETSNVPSGENETELTVSECPLSVRVVGSSAVFVRPWC